MRFATIFVLGAAVISTYASLVVRQNVPTCYLTCLSQLNLTACNGDQTNIKCICTNSGIVQSSTACVESTCTGSDLTAAITAGQKACEAVGVTVSIPGSSSGSSASATASSTAAASASAAKTSSASTATASTAAAAPAHGANAFISLAAVVGLVALAL